MPNGPPIDKWNICKNVILKKFTKSLRFEFSWKSTKEFEHGEFVFGGCKVNNMLTFFEATSKQEG